MSDNRPPRVIAPLRDVDLWNIDNYLADVIANALREFKTSEGGYPGDTTVEGWHSELDTMIEGFAAYAAADSRPVHMGRCAEKTDVALDLFRKRFYDLWT